MKTPLHILHLEDDPHEVDLVHDMLEAEGVSCSINYAHDKSGFTKELERGDIDLIIADQSLPGFDGLSALKIARSKWPEMPFILMSGTVGEEFAIESLKSGVTDYVLKDRRSRLVPAVRRAMQEVEDRLKHRQLEKQFIEAQKMEVLGQLSGGIAHDFNNILGIIIGNNEFVMAKLHFDDPLRKNMEEIKFAAERAVAVSRQLLVFSRKQAVELVVLSLNEVIQSMDKMLFRLVNEHIELTVILGEKLGSIRGDSGYIGQMLMNLVINARDAMPNGGSLTIETSNARLGKKLAPSHPDVVTDRHVMLSIRDTGTGMTDDVKAKLFEAFFTTKPEGKGTGLGLATCQSIAKQLNAHIDVESELGKGTTFKVYFPRVDQPLHKLTTRLLHSISPARGTETLLIVEDETALRRMTSMALENQGYTILQASNGQEGLRVVSEHKGQPIALVITDVVMPQMGGKLMAEWLKSSYPEIKILFTSGYTEDSIVQQSARDPTITFLSKPYTLATLAGKIREILDNKL